MKGKYSTHLVNVPKASNSSTSDPDYYNEHGDPVDAHIVNVQDNKCKHLIQFPISTELEKVGELGGKFYQQWKVSYCSTKS